jgi:hypothetical protein
MVDANSPDDVQERGLENAANPAEGIDQADGQPAPNVFPLFEMIDDFVAQHLVLQDLFTTRITRADLISDKKHHAYGSEWDVAPWTNHRFQLWRSGWDTGQTSHSTSNPAHLLQQVTDLDPHDHAVLVVEDINADWYRTLCTRFPGAVDAKFLAQHILRLVDFGRTFARDNQLTDVFGEMMGHVDAAISQKASDNPIDQQYHGHHVDFEIPALRLSNDHLRLHHRIAPVLRGYRAEAFSR